MSITFFLRTELDQPIIMSGSWADRPTAVEPANSQQCQSVCQSC
jgi:hypothetical protein